jgi:hypothetical protein
MVCEPAPDLAPSCPLFKVYPLFLLLTRAARACCQADRAIRVQPRGSERGDTTTTCLANEANSSDHRKPVLSSSKSVSWLRACACGPQVLSPTQTGYRSISIGFSHFLGSLVGICFGRWTPLARSVRGQRS